VLVDDTPVDKPGMAIRSDARVRVRGEDRRFVSRGGEKLAGALEDLGVDPTGRICLDIGASTGGFTDCLLQSGARRVFAVDVGYGQLDARLRADPRVTVMERTNARHLEAAALDPRPDLVAIDVSFISVRLLLPNLAGQLPARAGREGRCGAGSRAARRSRGRCEAMRSRVGLDGHWRSGEPTSRPQGESRDFRSVRPASGRTVRVFSGCVDFR
jgi:hypothetical protein